MNRDYNKYLGLKMFLIEQVVMNNLVEEDSTKLKRALSEVLNIVVSSPEGIKARMEK